MHTIIEHCLFDSFSVHSFFIFLCLQTANRMFWMPQQTNKRSYCYYMNVEIIYWKAALVLVKMSKGYHIEKVSNVMLIVQEAYGWLGLKLHSGARFEFCLSRFPSSIVMQMLLKIFKKVYAILTIFQRNRLSIKISIIIR